MNYTVIVRENNSIEIIGSETLLDIKPDAYKNPIVDVTCSKFEECLVVMTDEWFFVIDELSCENHLDGGSLALGTKVFLFQSGTSSPFLKSPLKSK